MTEKRDVYDELGEMYAQEDPVGIGGPKTPSLLKVLSLQFTKAEADLSLKIRFTGGTLDEISEKSGIKKDKLQKMLLRMADKGIIFYNPSLNDPVYSVVPTAAPGIIETGLWCGIKFPFSVELAKAMYQYLKEWSENRLCTLGVPFAPVWAGENTLPKDAIVGAHKQPITTKTPVMIRPTVTSL